MPDTHGWELMYCKFVMTSNQCYFWIVTAICSMDPCPDMFSQIKFMEDIFLSGFILELPGLWHNVTHCHSEFKRHSHKHVCISIALHYHILHWKPGKKSAIFVAPKESGIGACAAMGYLSTVSVHKLRSSAFANVSMTIFCIAMRDTACE